MKKAEATRQMILEKAFELIYVRGYQATSVDDIIARTQVTKGAFYYHFKQKDEMGMAIIEEVLKPHLAKLFLVPLTANQDPLEQIYISFKNLLLEDKFLKLAYGCPVANLAQEMSPLNRRFGVALNELKKKWEKELTAKIEQGRSSGMVRVDVQAKTVVTFILSGYWGVRILGKISNTKTPYHSFLKELKNYLDALR